MTTRGFLAGVVLQSLPRYWRRLIGWATLFVIVTSISGFLDMQRASNIYESQIGNGTGPDSMTVHFTIFTIAAFVLTMTFLVAGTVHCIFRSIYDRNHGGHTYYDAGLLHRFLGAVRPVSVPFGPPVVAVDTTAEEVLHSDVLLADATEHQIDLATEQYEATKTQQATVVGAPGAPRPRLQCS